MHLLTRLNAQNVCTLGIKWRLARLWWWWQSTAVVCLLCAFLQTSNALMGSSYTLRLLFSCVICEWAFDKVLNRAEKMTGKKKQENGGIFNVRKNFVQLKLRSLRSSLERKKKIKQAASRESSCKENCQRVFFFFNSSLTGLSSSFSVLYLPSFKKKKMNEKNSCVLCNTIKDRHWLTPSKGKGI